MEDYTDTLVYIHNSLARDSDRGDQQLINVEKSVLNNMSKRIIECIVGTSSYESKVKELLKIESEIRKCEHKCVQKWYKSSNGRHLSSILINTINTLRSNHYVLIQNQTSTNNSNSINIVAIILMFAFALAIVYHDNIMIKPS